MAEDARTVGVFGGSFDPPHVAHLIVAETLREQFAFDQIWWMPAYQPPHKTDAAQTPAHHRLAMTRAATQTNPAFLVSALEVEREGLSYTVDTLRLLQDRYPEVAFMLIVGGDSWADFDAWHRPDEIVRRVPLVVYPRPGAVDLTVPPPYAERVHIAEAPLLEVSSTLIRERRRDGRSIRYLVPEPVRAYIIEHGLYADSGK